MDMLPLDAVTLGRRLEASGVRVERLLVRPTAAGAGGGPSAHVVVELTSAAGAVRAPDRVEKPAWGAKLPLQVPMAAQSAMERAIDAALLPAAQQQLVRLLEDALSRMLGRPVTVALEEPPPREPQRSDDGPDSGPEGLRTSGAARSESVLASGAGAADPLATADRDLGLLAYRGVGPALAVVPRPAAARLAFRVSLPPGHSVDQRV